MTWSGLRKLLARVRPYASLVLLPAAPRARGLRDLQCDEPTRIADGRPLYRVADVQDDGPFPGRRWPQPRADAHDDGLEEQWIIGVVAQCPASPRHRAERGEGERVMRHGQRETPIVLEEQRAGGFREIAARRHDLANRVERRERVDVGIWILNGFTPSRSSQRPARVGRIQCAATRVTPLLTIPSLRYSFIHRFTVSNPSAAGAKVNPAQPSRCVMGRSLAMS